MEYVYAALLLDAAGKEITDKSIEEVVKAAGMQPDEAQAKAVAASLKGVNIKDVIKNAQTMQVSAAPAHAATAQDGQHGEKKEKKAEKEEKKSEEEAASGLAGLFG